MLDVMINLGETLFQSSDVRGAVCSGVFELDSSASGVSFWVGLCRREFELRACIELFWSCAFTPGKVHSRR